MAVRDTSTNAEVVVRGDKARATSTVVETVFAGDKVRATSLMLEVVVSPTQPTPTMVVWVGA